DALCNEGRRAGGPINRCEGPDAGSRPSSRAKEEAVFAAGVLIASDDLGCVVDAKRIGATQSWSGRGIIQREEAADAGWVAGEQVAVVAAPVDERPYDVARAVYAGCLGTQVARGVIQRDEGAVAVTEAAGERGGLDKSADDLT